MARQLSWQSGDYSGTALGGNDTIRARDGEIDQVTCGWGADNAELDAGDLEDVDCETVDRPAATPGGSTGGGGSTPTGLTVRLVKPRPVGLRALAKGKALFVTATISKPCSGTLKLAVSAAEAHRARLRSLKRLKTTLPIVCTDASGATARHALPVTLTR